MKEQQVNDIKKRIGNILDRAKKENIDIMVFPEMLGNEEINEYVQGKLESSFEEKDYPALIISPSVWKDKHNTCTIFNRFGDILGKQEKQNPFVLKDTYWEDLNPEKEILLFHCKGIGRLAVTICADALNNDYRDLLFKKLKVSFLIVPSYSSGFHDFELVFGASEIYDISGVWINSCSALVDNKTCVAMAKNSGKEYENIKCYEMCGEAECKRNCFYKHEFMFRKWK